MIDNINIAWQQGARNVMGVLPTGTGKTVIFSRIIRDHNGPAVTIAHRQELVGQISVALARDGVRHKIIGPDSLRKYIIRLHIENTGKVYFDPQSPIAVASVDTLIRRGAQLAKWLPTVTLWVQDEAHHIQRKNKWGRAAAMFENARGLGVTATPLRADGRGLSRATDGLMDQLVIGPPMRSIIERRYLSDYRIFAPTTSDLDLSDVTVTSTGDYSKPKLVKAVRKSTIIGDVVGTYLKYAAGKLGITFATDVETAADIADEYRNSGVPAEVVDTARSEILRRFQKCDILQLVNVDLFGEGFDLPAVEVASFARPTQSYGLYVQQFGRPLRPLPDKTHALIIDHVGNVVRHGLPDSVRTWSLDRRIKRQQHSETIPVRACPNCTYVYLKTLAACPDCGYAPKPQSRSAPQHVDGDLTELDAETLARMRGEADRSVMDPIAYRADLIRRGCPVVGLSRNIRNHNTRRAAQIELREAIGVWGAYRRREGLADSESYKRFYFKFGIDVLSAQSLGTADALALAERVRNDEN
jgi:superfamily II DNA or RNA helicase